MRRLLRSGSLRRGVSGRLLHPQSGHRGNRGRPARPRQGTASRTDFRRRFPLAVQRPDGRRAGNSRPCGERRGRACSGRRADHSRGPGGRSAGSDCACRCGPDAETGAAQESRGGKNLRGRARRDVCRGIGARAGAAEPVGRRHAARLGPAGARRPAALDQTRPGTVGRRPSLFQRRYRHQPQHSVQHAAVPDRARRCVCHGAGRRDIQSERQLLHLSGHPARFRGNPDPPARDLLPRDVRGGCAVARHVLRFAAGAGHGAVPVGGAPAGRGQGRPADRGVLHVRVRRKGRTRAPLRRTVRRRGIRQRLRPASGNAAADSGLRGQA